MNIWCFQENIHCNKNHNKKLNEWDFDNHADHESYVSGVGRWEPRPSDSFAQLVCPSGKPNIIYAIIALQYDIA